MSQALTVAALLVAAATILAVFVAIVRSDRLGEHTGATGTWSPADDFADVDEEAYEVDAIEQPDDDRRGLSPHWHELVTPPAQQQLFADLDLQDRPVLPIVPGHPYRGRHHEDTVEIVRRAHRMPATIVDPALAAFVGRPVREVVPDGI